MGIFITFMVVGAVRYRTRYFFNCTGGVSFDKKVDRTSASVFISSRTARAAHSFRCRFLSF